MPISSASRSAHLPCSAGLRALPANSGSTRLRASGGKNFSLTKKPKATAAITATKPSRSCRATLLGAAASFRRGSASADNTAAATIRPAMKRYTSGQVQPPPWVGSTQMKAMPPDRIIASR